MRKRKGMHTHQINISDEVLEQFPDMLLSEGLLVVHLSVNITVVQEQTIGLLHLHRQCKNSHVSRDHHVTCITSLANYHRCWV